MPELLISIVSHRQGRLAGHLIQDLDGICRLSDTAVVVTLNVDEPLPRELELSRLPIHLIRNPSPKGFAANHNAAFRSAPSRYFCVLNPDVRLPADPFPALLTLLDDPDNALAAPAVVDARGVFEDSARRIPTPWSIIAKALLGPGRTDYDYGDAIVYPDWVAGMFMLLESAIFAELGGFDERYFLYYEDVDLCCRIRFRGKRVALDPRVRVVHEARRTSHRDPRYLRWHLQSMLRFFGSATYRRATAARSS